MKVIILSNQSRSMYVFWRVLIARMKAANMAVTCCVPPGDAQSDNDLAQLGCDIRHYYLERKGLNPFGDFKTYRELKALFRQEKADILFATTIKPVIYGCIAAHMAGMNGIFATITGLGYAFEADTPLKKFLNKVVCGLYRKALANASGIFFQNRDDLALFQKRKILGPAAKIFLARGTGVDVTRFEPQPFPPEPPAAPLVFLLVARLLEAKGLREYAGAAAILKKQFGDARFQVLGPRETGRGGIGKAELEEWEKDGRISYLGETKDIRPFVGACHVVVLPSWREGTPTSLMEACAMGRPCVATDVPGCREVVENGVNGWLAQSHNPQSLANAMKKFLLDPDSIKTMGAKSREIAVNKFDAQKVAAGIMADMFSALPAQAGDGND